MLYRKTQFTELGRTPFERYCLWVTEQASKGRIFSSVLLGIAIILLLIRPTEIDRYHLLTIWIFGFAIFSSFISHSLYCLIARQAGLLNKPRAENGEQDVGIK